jgi:hypothetical protein
MMPYYFSTVQKRTPKNSSGTDRPVCRCSFTRITFVWILDLQAAINMIGSRQSDCGGDACNIWYAAVSISCGVPGLLQISILASAGGYISSTPVRDTVQTYTTPIGKEPSRSYFGFMTCILSPAAFVLNDRDIYHSHRCIVEPD